MDPSRTMLSAFMDIYDYTNLIRNNACFEGQNSCIDLISSSRKYCFKHIESFETGLSDHHHFICSMLTTAFEKEVSKAMQLCG